MSRLTAKFSVLVLKSIFVFLLLVHTGLLRFTVTGNMILASVLKWSETPVGGEIKLAHLTREKPGENSF